MEEFVAYILWGVRGFFVSNTQHPGREAAGVLCLISQSAISNDQLEPVL